MMKILAIFLVITSLVAAGGIFSPHEEKKKNPKNDDLIVKENHRLVVVEYERETTGFGNPGHHYPQQLHQESASRSHHHKEEDKEYKPLEHGLSSASSMLGRSNERLKDSMPDLRPTSSRRRGSLSSDAYEKSEDRVLEKTPDVREVIDKVIPDVRKAVETSHQVKEKVMNKAHDAKAEVMVKTHNLNEAIEGSDTKRIPEAVHHAKNNVLGKTRDLKESAVEDSYGLNQAKGKVSEKPHNVNEAPGDSGETADGYMKGMPDEILNQAREKVSDKVHLVKEEFENTSNWKEKVIDRAQSVKQAVGEAKESATEKAKGLPETINNAKENILDKAHGFKAAVEDSRTRIPETLNQAKDKVYKKIQSSKAKEQVAEKSHVSKQSAKELILPGEKEKASQDSEGLIKMAQEKIINTAQGIKEGAGNVKESLKGFVVEDLEETLRMTKSAITDKRSARHKTTMLFKEGARNLTNVFQSGWEMAVSHENVKWGLGVMRLVGYGTAYGSSMWVFVFSHLLDRVLPRQQFAAAQSKIYRVYYRLIGFSIGSSMVAQILRRACESAQTKYQKGDKIHAYDLHMALVFVLVNLLLLEPRATKVMMEKMKWEREEGKGIHRPSETQVTSWTRTAVSEDVTEEIVTEPSHEEEVERQVRVRANNELGKLNQRLKKLDRYSAFFNILTIMTLTWHITFLARCLYVSC